MNILIIASNFQNEHIDGYPACLAEINSIPLIERIVAQAKKLPHSKLIFSFPASDIQNFHLDDLAYQLDSNANIISVNTTSGAACTALLSSDYIDNDKELLIMSATELVNIDLVDVISHFKTNGYDAGCVVFPSIHPRYSFLRIDEHGLVLEAAEKKPISRHASAGLYWFAHGGLFVNAAKSMIRKDVKTNEQYYLCPVFNELLLKNAKIGTYPILTEQYIPLKSSHQIENADIF